MKLSVDQVIKLYNLKPHPEGGYYQETYRSKELIPKQALGEEFNNNRSYSTAILFLLPKNSFSRIHRLLTDELWHFYLGGPLVLVIIKPDGQISKTILGQDIEKGQQIQFLVPAGSWFGAYPKENTLYSLVGCTTAPGFDFADFELGQRQDLIKQFPHAREIIEKLTVD